MTDDPPNFRNVFKAAALTLGLLLAMSCAVGCVEQGGGGDNPAPAPIPTSNDLEQLSYQAERSMPAGNAAVYEALAARADAEEFQSGSALMNAVYTSCKAVRDTTYAPGDDAFSAIVQPDGKYDNKAAAVALRALAAGARRAAQ